MDTHTAIGGRKPKVLHTVLRYNSIPADMGVKRSKTTDTEEVLEDQNLNPD